LRERERERERLLVEYDMLTRVSRPDAVNIRIIARHRRFSRVLSRFLGSAGYGSTELRIVDR